MGAIIRDCNGLFMAGLSRPIADVASPLAILSCLNFLNYLYWASWYKYKSEDPDPKSNPKALNGTPLIKDESTQENGDKIKETSSFDQIEDGGKETEAS